MSQVTAAGSLLLGLEGGQCRSRSRTATLGAVLGQRLAVFAASSPPVDTLPIPASEDEDALKQTTAHYATLLLSHAAAEAAAAAPAAPAAAQTAPHPPRYGSRDSNVIRTLAGVVGRWGIAPRVQDGVLPASVSERSPRARITDVDDDGDRLRLEHVVRPVLDTVLLAKGVHRDSGAGQLAALVLPQLLLPLVGALVQLAYKDPQPPAWAQQSLARLLSMNTPIVVLSTLLALHSAAASHLTWLRPNLGNLLSAQLLRPGGVRSLLLLVAGTDDEVGLPKLEMLSRLLGAAPSGVTSEAYFASVMPQLLAILQAAANASIAPPPKSTAPLAVPPPAAVTRAAAFVYSTLVSQNPTLASTLHALLLPSAYPAPADSAISLSPTVIPSAMLLRSLTLVSTVLLHSPPLPSLLPTLLSPLLPLLLSLSSFLTPPATEDADGNPIVTTTPTSIFAAPANEHADAALRDEADALLETWGKALAVDAALVGLVRAVESIERGDEWGRHEASYEFCWARDDESGEVVVQARERDPDREQMKVRLEPQGVVRVLGSIGRKELSAKAFLRWLDEVQVLRTQDGLDAAKRSVLRLQLVLKMVEEMGAELLEDPTQIIAFVAHALDASAPQPDGADEPPPRPSESQRTGGLGLDDLKIVDEEDQPAADDDDDAEENIVPGLGPDEMAITALTLLLAVLDANEDLNMTTTPLLSLIYARLSSLAAGQSTLIPPLAREARMVLSLRRASDLPPTTASGSTDPLAASRATYQDALKLLQDPILPVRAQGLAHLRSLVATRDALLSTDPALIPAVLDIFVQAVEDDDSFLYLNAIQGLAALVDSYGRQVVRRLVQVYLGGRNDRVADLSKGESGRREMDKRLRMGEALVLVVQRAAEAIALFVDDLVPALLLILRTSTLPTPLRSSALTILATTVESAPTAMLEYADTLAEACLTLLSIESRPLQPRPREAPPPAASTLDDSDEQADDDDDDLGEEPRLVALGRDGKPKRAEETPQPTSADAKQQPSLRRAAVLFLGLLFRTASHVVDEQTLSSTGVLDGGLQGLAGRMRMPGAVGGRERRLVSSETRRRSKTVLGYVGQTDEDALVRHQAGEVLNEMGF